MATRKTKTRRRLALVAVLTASVAAAALSARRPRARTPRAPRPRPEPRRAPEVPGEQPVTPRLKLHRRLTLAALLTASAAIATLSAYEEQNDGELGLSTFGLVVVTLVLVVASWRGGWARKEDYYFPLVVSVLGVSCLVFGGPAVVTEVVLAHRGVPVQVEVLQASFDANGGGTYRLVLPGGSTPLRGDLRTDVEFAAGERFTALVDRGRFVRPMLPEDVDPAVPASFVLGGAGILGVTVLRSGYPLRRPTATG